MRGSDSPLRLASRSSVDPADLRRACPGDALLELDDRGDVVQEPRVDPGALRATVSMRHALADGLGDPPQALRAWAG